MRVFQDLHRPPVNTVRESQHGSNVAAGVFRSVTPTPPRLWTQTGTSSNPNVGVPRVSGAAGNCSQASSTTHHACFARENTPAWCRARQDPRSGVVFPLRARYEHAVGYRFFTQVPEQNGVNNLL